MLKCAARACTNKTQNELMWLKIGIIHNFGLGTSGTSWTKRELRKFTVSSQKQCQRCAFMRGNSLPPADLGLQGFDTVSKV